MLITLVSSFYLMAAVLWFFCVNSRQPRCRSLVHALAIVAWLGHAWLLYRWIDTPALAQMGSMPRTQNVHATNVFSLIIWTSLLLIRLFALRRPKWLNVAAMLFPIAAGSVLLVCWLPGTYLLATGESPSQLIHILLAVLTFSVFSIAMLQAILLSMQDRLLRRKHVTGWFKLLPPLETMETILSVLVILGFIGLTIVLLGSAIRVFLGYNEMTQTHSPYLASMAWLICLSILLGRRYAGWHGRVLTRWTIITVMILSASYFGVWLMAGIYI